MKIMPNVEKKNSQRMTKNTSKQLKLHQIKECNLHLKQYRIE